MLIYQLKCEAVLERCVIRGRSSVKAGSGGGVVYSRFSLTFASVSLTAVVKITTDAVERNGQLMRSCAQTQTRLHNPKCATCPPTTHSHTHAWSLWWITNRTTCPPEHPRSPHINTHRFPSAGLHGTRAPRIITCAANQVLSRWGATWSTFITLSWASDSVLRPLWLMRDNRIWLRQSELMDGLVRDF